MEFALHSKNNSEKHLNTGSCCFFCLKSEFSESFMKKVGRTNLQFVELRSLFRHLRIKEATMMTEDAAYQNSFPETVKAEEISVHLCDLCEADFNRFKILFVAFERIQMEMNYFLKGFNQTILQSRDNMDLFQAFTKEMIRIDEGKAFSQFTLVENLRKEIANKSLDRQEGRSAYIELTRINTDDEGQRNKIETRNSRMDCVSDDCVKIECSDDDDAPDPLSDDMLTCFASSSTSENSTQINIIQESANPIGINPRPTSNTVFYYMQNGSSKCDLCGKTFAKKDLSLHRKRVHLTGKALSCDSCDKKFKHPWNLREHKESVHLGKKFNCRFCNHSFSHKPSCRRHEKMCAQHNSISNT